MPVLESAQVAIYFMMPRNLQLFDWLTLLILNINLILFCTPGHTKLLIVQAVCLVLIGIVALKQSQPQTYSILLNRYRKCNSLFHILYQFRVVHLELLVRMPHR